MFFCLLRKSVIFGFFSSQNWTKHWKFWPFLKILGDFFVKSTWFLYFRFLKVFDVGFRYWPASDLLWHFCVFGSSWILTIIKWLMNSDFIQWFKWFKTAQWTTFRKLFENGQLKKVKCFEVNINLKFTPLDIDLRKMQAFV